VTQNTLNADSLLTSHQVATLLQVNPSSVNKWVRDGRIAAFRTPGGHRRISAADLVTFLNAHQMPLPRQLTTLSRRRLLVVDSDKKQVKALGRALKPYGDRVESVVVESGIDALASLGWLHPHILVLDAQDAESDALTVCRRLKGSERTRDITVIVATSKPGKDYDRTAEKAGAAQVVAKPVDYKPIVDGLGA
jgi:excisionase family DNA binding protein